MEHKQNFEEERAKIILGLKLVRERLIKFKQYKNSPIIVTRDGKIVAVDPFDLDSYQVISDPHA